MSPGSDAWGMDLPSCHTASIMSPTAELLILSKWEERSTPCSHSHSRPGPTGRGQASSTLNRGRTFQDRHDAEELEVQAGNRCLSDVLAQFVHRRQSEGNLIPVQDLQEANLQREGSGKEAPSPNGLFKGLPWSCHL